MGLKKISDVPKTCLHPEHDPPRHYAYENGTYEYTCPGCSKKQVFTVSLPTL